MTTQSPDQPSVWQRSTTRRFLKWLFSWRTARRALIGVAVLVTLYALFCTEENVRGKRAWDKCRRELEARGEQLDLKTFIPQPVPDEQNFAATPFIKSWFVRSNYSFVISSKYWDGDNYGLVSARVSTDRSVQDEASRRFMDLVAWKAAFDTLRAGELKPNQMFKSDKLDRESRAMAAPSVLEALETNEAVFVELRAASRRPYSRYPVQYNLEDPWGILLPHLNSVRNVCRRLRLKACAELAVGQNVKALEDVKLTLYMADSVKEEPFIISYLVRVACVQSAIQPVWEGLAEHTWSVAQLHELQARLQQYDFVADLRRPFDAERAAGILTPELIRKKGLGLLVDLTSTGGTSPSHRACANLAGLVIPSGWYSLEQLNYCRLYQLELAGTFDATQKRVSPSRIKANAHELEQAFDGQNFIHHRTIAAIILPALGNVVRRAAQVQVAADQAALACALERYRLANGRFPDTLDALVPRFISQLPHDVITGEPYKYRRAEAGQFLLYSVGWNEKDDGGVPGKTLFDKEEGDWVWLYPERQ
jgi:hypothetical protein